MALLSEATIASGVVLLACAADHVFEVIPSAHACDHAQRMAALVHVVNGAFGAESVRETLPPRLSDRVLAHSDSLAVGSLVGLADDPFARVPVLQSIVKRETHPMLDDAHFREGMRSDAAMLDTIRRSRGVVVWTSNEAADRLAMLRVVAALEGIDNRVFEIDVTPFIRWHHGGLRPIGLSQKGELNAALTVLRHLDAHERAARTTEFARWSKSDALVRGMRDGALVELDAEFVDACILEAIPPRRVSFAHAVGHAMASVYDFMASDLLVASRICALIERGVLTLDGELGWETGFVTKT